MSISKRLGRTLAPKVTELAPHLTASFVHQALDRAIRGVGPLDGAAWRPRSSSTSRRATSTRRIREVIENNVRLAGAQGFLTNIGGLVTMAVTVPANISRAGAASSAGWSPRSPTCAATTSPTSAPATRSWPACWARSGCSSLIKKKKLPGTPMALATAPVYDPQLDNDHGQRGGLRADHQGRRQADRRHRGTPGADRRRPGGRRAPTAFATWRIGRYVDREFLPRNRR